MKPSIRTLLNAKPYRRGVYSATLALSLGVAWPAWAAAPFAVNGNGTVTDSSTSLVWDQCPYGLSGSTCATGTAFYGDWPTALTQATQANAASYKGFNDWRVPNKNELESLAKLDTSSPAIDASAFPGTPSNYFWTSTTYAPNPGLAWIVDFNSGSTGAYNETVTYYVRLVRSGQSLASFDSLATSQSYTAATATATGNGTASFTGGGAGCAFGSAQFQAAPAAPPSGVTMPHGAFNFATTNCGAGATVNFTITYPQVLPAGTQYYKYGPEFGASQVPHWYVVPATVSGNQITFSITDNGLGDDNPAAGFISDPGAPGVPGGAGVGFAGVPTLSEWGVIILTSLMALFGVAQIRRRRGAL